MWRIVDVVRAEHRRSHIDFLNSIYCAQLQREKHLQFKPYNSRRKYVNLGGEVGRTMLISWLFNEGDKLQLNISTSFLSVSYLERLLSTERVPLSTAQDLASACLIVAIKLAQVGGDVMDLPDPSEIPVKPALELRILQELSWDLIQPTACTFLGMFGERIWLPHHSRKRGLQYLRYILSCKKP